MPAKYLFPILIAILTLCASAVVAGFIIPLSGAYHRSEWQQLTLEGQSALVGHHLEAADKFLRLAVQEIDQVGWARADQAETRTYLGEVSRLRERYQESQVLFDSAVRLYDQEIAGIKDPAALKAARLGLTDTLSRLAMLYDDLGRTVEAVHVRERAVQIYDLVTNEKTSPKPGPSESASAGGTIPGGNLILAEQMVRNYNGLAENAFDKAKYADSRKNYARAIMVGTKIYVPEDLWLRVCAGFSRLIEKTGSHDDPLVSVLEKEGAASLMK